MLGVGIKKNLYFVHNKFNISPNNQADVKNLIPIYLHLLLKIHAFT
jgi:hypothetical protein